ncbi:WD domain G-beta repeat [Phytophthora infestans]|uniref:WD domain G-beta repeat n=1 Tax=Phytophthora infestans TaxID=4787 RepID=A0A833RYN2_PHYIN|nr:WD domain G-beta repeat [Phytophthora infestans]
MDGDEKPIKRLAPSVTISDCASEVFCTRFSPDGKLLAAGCGDGAIRVFNVHDGKLSYTLIQPQSSYGFGLPCTAIRFRPLTSATKTKNVLLAANSNGSVEHWHITSGKCLNAITNTQNQLYALDYREDGALFATGGKDHGIRVYDEATKAEVACMDSGHGTLTAGHSNRVFSIKFAPEDDNTIVSGGWDNTLQIWDIRVGHSVRSIYGPHVAGDAVDMNTRGEILTGSWRPENPLELWDFGSGKRLLTVPWNQSAIRSEPCFLYSAQFSKLKTGQQLIAAGGSGSNEAKVFNHDSNNKLVGTIAGLSRGVFTLDFAAAIDKMVVAGADAAIRIIDVYDHIPGEKSRERPTTPSIRNALMPHESLTRLASPL